MMKKLVQKAVTTEKTMSATQGLPAASDMAVNELIVNQNLNEEEEKAPEVTFKDNHVDSLRISRAPLLFGIDAPLTYPQHQHMHIQGCLQNFNNKVYATWDFKALHVWSMDSGARVGIIKMIDVTKTHCTISTVAFSHKYRLYLVITSLFKFIFLNEKFYVVTMLDMSELSTVNFCHFNDKQRQLVTAGIKGVQIHNFKYTSKYDAKLAATIDETGKYINIDFTKSKWLEPPMSWIKGMKIDERSGIFVTWSQGKLPGASKNNKMGNAAAVCFNKASVCFNWLNSRQPVGNDNGARPEEEIDEATINKTTDAVRKLITSQKLTDGIVEGTDQVIQCIEDKTILVVVLANDILDQKFKKKIMDKATACNANVIQIGKRDELGAWLGHCKYDKHRNPIKITPTALFALKDYGDEFESYQLVRSFIKTQKVMRQNRTGDLIALFRDIMDFGEQILDVLVFIDYRYFLISTDEGNIYVYKYVQSGKVEQTKRLIHTYSGHNKNITHLEKMQKFPHLFMSASLDGTARVWSLETFTHLYTIEIPSPITFCNLLSRCQIILSQGHGEVHVHQLHMIIENYMNSESQVIQIAPSYHSLEDKDGGKVGFTISVCQDNSAVIKDIDESLASYEKTTLYPPPSAQTIMKIVYSTTMDRLILLLSSSTICIYKRVKETALLEKILDPSEIKDCEMKRAFSQQVTCMEIIHTQNADQILPFDTEVLNLRQHEEVLEEALSDRSPKKEFVILGLSKGAILLFHVAQLSQLYCRFTVHREKIKIIKYLPNTNTFMTVCKEGDVIFWQISDDRKVNKLRSFKVPSDRKVKMVHVVAAAYHRHRTDIPNDRIMIIFKSGESEIFDFEIGDGVTLNEGEDKNDSKAHLYLLENEKQKEHDCKVTGVDSNKYVRLMVTSDISGNIKIWSLDKRFMREINFPHPVDSVCFLNERGDILVSHVQRISKVKYETYWTSSFTNFGFTDLNDPLHLKYKQYEATIETEIYDDHIFEKAPLVRTRVINSDHFESLFRLKDEDETTTSQGNFSQAGSTQNIASALMKAGASMVKGKLSGMMMGVTTSDQAGSSAMENVNMMTSRLGDSALRKMQQSANPFAPRQEVSGNASGAVDFLAKLTDLNKNMQKTQVQAPQAPMQSTKQKTSAAVPARPLRVKRNSSMTLFQLQEKEAQHAREDKEEADQIFQDKLKRMNGPCAQDAIPRERNPFAQKQVLQPLPGISYLSTSPVYYEMLAKRQKQKGKIAGLTRRKITENRISGNIMNFNCPTAINDFSDMELSVDYHTQVSQNKYNQSNFLPLMNLQILSKIPIEQILNPNMSGEHTQIDLGMPPTAMNDMNTSQHSRKSRSNINMQYRTNSFGGVSQADRHSRNTNRSGKETAASHVTHGSNRHSLVKPIGFTDGQQHLHAMLQPNSQVVDQRMSNGRNGGRPTQRTNIIMTGNQIVGGSLHGQQYPKTTRNATNQQIILSQQRSGGAEDALSISQFDNSLIIEGNRAKVRTNADGSQITGISAIDQSSFIGSDIKIKEGNNPDGSQQITQMLNMSNHGGQQVSQNTQDTSKQVFGSKQMMTPVSRNNHQATIKMTEISMMAGELASIKENEGGTQHHSRQVYNMPAANDGLVQDDSIIENDQPSVMLPKGRQAVNDYKEYMKGTPDKNMNLTGDSFADSIMSNHYQNK